MTWHGYESTMLASKYRISGPADFLHFESANVLRERTDSGTNRTSTSENKEGNL
ncbi:MAG: hypothetical protein U5L07_06755 [Desulfobacterales bacterium]|nr:hypothetical protein [Desulfobacterales bacterium]